MEIRAPEGLQTGFPEAGSYVGRYLNHLPAATQAPGESGIAELLHTQSQAVGREGGFPHHRPERLGFIAQGASYIGTHLGSSQARGKKKQAGKAK